MDYSSSTVLELTLVNSVHVFYSCSETRTPWSNGMSMSMEVPVIVIANSQLSKRAHGGNEKIHAHHLSSE